MRAWILTRLRQLACPHPVGDLVRSDERVILDEPILGLGVVSWKLSCPRCGWTQHNWRPYP